MSLSSSADPRRPFTRWLAESFTLLEHEAPAWHAACCAALEGQTVALTVGLESLRVRFAEGRASVLPGAGPADLVIHTTRPAILDVLHGRVRLAEAVESGRVDAIAPVDTLADALNALRWYIHGAVRAPAMERHLRSYEGDAPCAT